MGGHGGLNILPQKSWNVYNYENREKVRRDEEAAAKEEQLKREQSRKRDAEFRLECLRQARGVATPGQSGSSAQIDDSKHINLFEGLPNFLSLDGNSEEKDTKKEAPRKKQRKEEAAAPKVILPEDEKYRLGYGIAGKGVKAPWYLARTSLAGNDEEVDERDSGGSERQECGKKTGKKSLQELREERTKREKREKEREREVMLSNRNRDRDVRGKNGKFSRRWS
ncbi:hypothetical protein H6P81_005248 [Aristolochia fimbriata]|uniref:CBF1-interacting co-repressor CIR N-terminal domain-containing protein n=1 Tax=Aristolochia fimbriata TaxID=158543 RepID=A0AAV7EV14_ARIFI|nr:hypothetical protein H6P81_005248 [Aristolochia fimbriata]